MRNVNMRNFLLLGCVCVLATCIPALLIHFWVIDAYTAQIVTLGAINAIMAVSVNMICGITGQLSLGQAGFMAVGAYTCAILAQAGLPLPLSVVAAALVTCVFGVAIGFPTLKFQGDYLAIVTLGFGEIIRVLLVNFKDLTGGANGKQFPSVLVSYADFSYFVIVGCLVLVLVFVQNFLRSTYGRAVLAVREDEIAANSCGVGVFRYKMIGFVSASCIAGLGGALYAPFIGFIKPDLASFNRSIDYLIFVVLGGMGSMTGSVIAAFVLTYLQEFLRFLQDYRLLIYPLILIVVMLFRPQGFLGMKEFSFVRAWQNAPRSAAAVKAFVGGVFTGKPVNAAGKKKKAPAGGGSAADSDAARTDGSESVKKE